MHVLTEYCSAVFKTAFLNATSLFFLPYYTAEQYEEIIKHAFQGCSSLYLEKWEKSIYLVKMGENYLFIWLNCKNKKIKIKIMKMLKSESVKV